MRRDGDSGNGRSQGKARTGSNLYQKQNRVILADRLFKEALDIYQSKNEEAGPAETYRQYAFFLVSPAVENREPHFRKDGFLLDRSITYDTRHVKAIEYFHKAGDLYDKNARYDLLSNIDMSMGKVYLSRIGDQVKACQYFDKSLADHEEFRQSHPDEKIQLPAGLESYADHVAMIKERSEMQLTAGPSDRSNDMGARMKFGTVALLIATALLAGCASIMAGLNEQEGKEQWPVSVVPWGECDGPC
jgi:tetratricopeptide (TPR) repeat protein